MAQSAFQGIRKSRLCFQIPPRRYDDRLCRVVMAPVSSHQTGPKGCQHLWNGPADLNPSGQPNPR
jgi:hypothetical protein